MQSELKACPFCGGEASTSHEGWHWYEVHCRKCECAGSPKQSEAEAIAAWNTRAEGDAQDAARYRGIRHAMSNNDPHFVDAAEQHLERLGLLGCKNISEDVIDAAFDAALKTSTGEGN